MLLIVQILILFLFSISAFSESKTGLLSGREQSAWARTMAIHNEQKELGLLTYIFGVDDFTKRKLGHFILASQRGVVVNLGIDGHKDGLIKHLARARALEEMGVKVRVYNPFYRKLHMFNRRNHQKGLFTSKYVFLGDRNIYENNFKTKIDIPYIGMDGVLEGDVADKARKLFKELYTNDEYFRELIGFVPEKEMIEARKELLTWVEMAKNDPILKKHFNVPMFEDDTVRYVADTNLGLKKNPNGLAQDIVAMIDRAEKSLDFMNPYVLLPPDIDEALKKAHARGVKISICSNSPETNNVSIMSKAWKVERKRLSELGYDVKDLKKGLFIHQKTIVRDGKEIFIGSFNLDQRSFYLNLENGFFSEEKTIVKRLMNRNHRIEKSFMVKFENEKFIHSKMTLKQRSAHCVENALNKAIWYLFHRDL